MKNTLNLTGVILCAGKGTRIKQLLFNKPKTLLEILGQPIIYHQLKYLKNVGVKKVLVVIGKSGNVIIDKIKTIPNLNLDITFIKDLKPRGSTALLDAMSETIKNIEDYESKLDKIPNKILVVVQTDGQENASNIFPKTIFDKITKLKKTGYWEFSFIGANIDAIKTGTKYGFSAPRRENKPPLYINVNFQYFQTIYISI